MSLTITPPVKPRPPRNTHQQSKIFWTIHSRPNDAFTLKLNEKSRTAVVGFKDIDNALLIGKMIETHFIHQREWPDTRKEGPLILPNSRVGDVLHHIYIQKWNWAELKITCTKNFLDMIAVEDIITTKTGYSFSGNFYRFDAEPDFYRKRIEELFTLE
jgi:hypothetical protein